MIGLSSKLGPDRMALQMTGGHANVVLAPSTKDGPMGSVQWPALWAWNGLEVCERQDYLPDVEWLEKRPCRPCVIGIDMNSQAALEPPNTSLKFGGSSHDQFEISNIEWPTWWPSTLPTPWRYGTRNRWRLSQANGERIRMVTIARGSALVILVAGKPHKLDFDFIHRQAVGLRLDLTCARPNFDAKACLRCIKSMCDSTAHDLSCKSGMVVVGGCGALPLSSVDAFHSWFVLSTRYL